MLTQKYHSLFIILAHSTHSSVCSLIRRIMVSLWGCSTFLSFFEIRLLILASILGNNHFVSGLLTKFEAPQISTILRIAGIEIAHMGCQLPIINEIPAVIALKITVTVPHGNYSYCRSWSLVHFQYTVEKNIVLIGLTQLGAKSCKSPKYRTAEVLQ